MNYKKEQLFVFDIETRPIYPDALTMASENEHLYKNWERVCESKEQDPLEDYTKCSFHPEFSQVAAISCGFFNGENFMVTGMSGENETILLKWFSELNLGTKRIAGQYIKGFDIPFLSKRYLLNKMSIPKHIYFVGKKPWEVDAVDSKELWQFGNLRDPASLDLMCAAFGIPSPKGSSDGSKVAEMALKGEWKEILEYCHGDVIANARVFQALLGEEYITDDKIVIK